MISQIYKERKFKDSRYAMALILLFQILTIVTLSYFASTSDHNIFDSHIDNLITGSLALSLVALYIFEHSIIYTEMNLHRHKTFKLLIISVLLVLIPFGLGKVILYVTRKPL
jgi:hypothetical protein